MLVASYHSSSKQIIVCLSLLFYCVTGYCQNNLVINSSFEQIELQNAGAWDEATSEAILDTFFLPALVDKNKARVRSIGWNYVKKDNYHHEDRLIKHYYSNTGLANTGKSFAEIIPIWLNEEEHVVINLNGTLSQPLEKGKEYKVSFYIRGSRNNYFTRSISVAFPKEKTPYEMGVNAETLKPTYQHNLDPVWSADHPISDSTYRKIEFEFTAEGGEKYIYIGNLDYGDDGYWDKEEFEENFVKADVAINSQAAGKKAPFHCVYAIDDVKVTLVNEGLVVNTSQSISPKSDSILLGSLHFNTDDHSNPLDDIGMMFEGIDLSKEGTSIVLVGHTDNEGSANYNQLLSIRRADKIAAFLSDELSLDQLIVIGKGASEPLSLSNASANRRVDVYLIQ